MNYIQLFKACNKSVVRPFSSQQQNVLIKPFINTNVTKKRFFASYSDDLEDVYSEDEEEEVEVVPTRRDPYEKPINFGPASTRPPPSLIDRLKDEEVFKQLDILLEESEGQTGGLHIPYTVDLRDKILVNQVLDMGRHCRVTASGRVFSYSALVLLGTCNGTAGIGYGKSDKPMDAVAKAQTDAQKRMISVSRWHDSVPHTIISEYRGTKVVMMAGRPGAGMKGHPVLQLVAEAFGLKDITCKTYRSRNTRKIVAAMVHGIIKNAHLHPASKAKMLGRRFVSREDYWKPPPPAPKNEVRKDWTTTSEPTDKERREAVATLATAPGIDILNFAREYGIDIGYMDVMFGKAQIADTFARDAEKVNDEEEEEEEDVEVPDFPNWIPEPSLVIKTLEERIQRETKAAPTERPSQ